MKDELVGADNSNRIRLSLFMVQLSHVAPAEPSTFNITRKVDRAGNFFRHRIVLASPNEYFKTALTTTVGHSMLGMSTARTPIFYLPQEFQLSMESLEALLRYLYAGMVNAIKTPTIAQQLNGVAEYLLISPKSDPARATSHEKFLTTCHEVESGPLTVDNCLDLLVSSWQLGHEELVEKASLLSQLLC
jgi:hypothetical protein